MKTPKWWPVYRCPKCGYASNVTNLCRNDSVWLVATGWEEHNRGGRHVRKMTKRSELFGQAVYASYAYKNNYVAGKEFPDIAKNEAKYYTVPPPDWAWYGEGDPKLKEEELYEDG